VLVDQRDEIIRFLNDQSIYPGVHYADNTGYPMYQDAAGTCPNAARAAKRAISLPLHLKLTKDDVRRVAEQLHKAVLHVSHTTAAV
jgi:dTDP-4-amino-4,6-dideoxygalactose transaminase